MFKRFWLALVVLTVGLPLVVNADANKKPTKKQLAVILKYHKKHADCGYKVDELTSDDVMMVEKITAVVGVRCNTGAYQGSSVFYLFDTDSDAPYVLSLSFATTTDCRRFFYRV